MKIDANFKPNRAKPEFVYTGNTAEELADNKKNDIRYILTEVLINNNILAVPPKYQKGWIKNKYAIEYAFLFYEVIDENKYREFQKSDVMIECNCCDIVDYVDLLSNLCFSCFEEMKEPI